MRYGPNEWVALQAEVESQGGAVLPDACKPDLIKELSVGHNKAHTCGCGHNARVVSVYECEKEQRERGGGFVTACAVCDDIGAWPRYQEAAL